MSVPSYITEVVNHEGRVVDQFEMREGILVDLRVRSRSKWLYAQHESLQDVHPVFYAVGMVLPFRLVGIHVVDVIVAVAPSAPSPVDVIEAVSVVAIDHKCMSAAIHSVSAAGHRMACCQLCPDELMQLVAMIEVTIDHSHPGVISEVVVEGIGLHDCLCSACFHSILHLHADAAIARQQRYGLCLTFAVVDAFVCVEHVIPIVGVGREIG